MNDQPDTHSPGSSFSRLKVGLIGDPISHSLSPAMQDPAFAALGIVATYELWPTSAKDLPARITSLRSPNTLGANVTVPHKLAVMDLVDEVNPLARKAGAVNTIVNRNGSLLGDNTDIHGFSAGLAGVCDDLAGRAALILGAGGAARAVALALADMGVVRTVIANRSTERARHLAADLAPTALTIIDYNDQALRSELPTVTILVNATSAGWHAGESPIPLNLLEALPSRAVVVDLTYRDTDLLQAARSRGLVTLDGLPMLVHQGARAFELWTGREAPVSLMLDAVQQARANQA